MVTRAEEILVEVRDLFDRRRNEVDRYLEFLVAIDDVRANAIAHVPDDGEAVFAPGGMSRELVKTLRANGYLLIYNLVESTMTNAIDAIHRCFDVDDCEFSALSEHLKKIVLENFKRVIGNGSEKVLGSDHPVQRAMITLGYNKEAIFSGNLDAREIRETASRYGFQVVERNAAESRGGIGLKSVKDTRNNLAHGKQSFEECGQQTSADSLRTTGREAIAYLSDALSGVEDFVKEGRYLSPQRQPSPP